MSVVRRIEQASRAGLTGLAEVVHIVLWKLKRPAGVTGAAAEDALNKARSAIANLKNVPGPEIVSDPLWAIWATVKGEDRADRVDAIGTTLD